MGSVRWVEEKEAGLAELPGVAVVGYDKRERNNPQYLIVELDAAVAGLDRDLLLALLRAENVVAKPDFAPGGHLLGMMTAASRRPAARAAMLRHILNVAIPSGRVVVSTSWPPYRVLSENLGLRAVGDTRDDLFRCGRRNRVLERTFTADTLGPWLRRMERDLDRPDEVVEAVRSALGLLRTPRALGDRPLLGLPGLATAAALAAFLRRQIEELAASELPADAEAGRILLRYYVLRNSGHDALIHQAHLSRATYFRRLDHGVRRIAEAARLLVDPYRLMSWEPASSVL